MVTDTDHCCVNTWREGLPAFCIGHGAQHSSGTLTEKKKELLFMMFNARRFYLFAENIAAAPGQDHAARQARMLLDDRDHLRVVHQAIADSTAVAEWRLRDALERLRAAPR